VIHRAIVLHKADIICLQETKLLQVDARILAQIVGGQFTDFVVVNAINTSGGILLMWKTKCFKLIVASTSSYLATVDLSLNLNNTTIRIT
jgi:exonuclease III